MAVLEYVDLRIFSTISFTEMQGGKKKPSGNTPERLESEWGRQGGFPKFLPASYGLPLIGATHVDMSVPGFSPIFLHHAMEDFKIPGGDMDQLIPDVVNIRVKGIDPAPFTASDKFHERLVGHLAGQIHEESKILVDRYRILAIQLESPGTDISQVTNDFECIIVD